MSSAYDKFRIKKRRVYILFVNGAEFGGKSVAVRGKNQLALAFHPELDDSAAVHEYFLNM